MGADRSSHRPGGGVIVTSISYAPVKGLGLVQVDEVELERTGVRENRRFHLIDDDGRLINGKFAGTLVQVAAATATAYRTTPSSWRMAMARPRAGSMQCASFSA